VHRVLAIVPVEQRAVVARKRNGAVDGGRIREPQQRVDDRAHCNQWPTQRRDQCSPAQRDVVVAAVVAAVDVLAVVGEDRGAHQNAPIDCACARSRAAARERAGDWAGTGGAGRRSQGTRRRDDLLGARVAAMTEVRFEVRLETREAVRASAAASRRPR
jgi:hypothetical protein